MKNKNKKFKSILSILLLVCLVFSSMPLSASAITSDDQERLNYLDGQQWKTSVPVMTDPAVEGDRYPGNTAEGYLQMRKAASWTNMANRNPAEIYLEVSGTPMQRGVSAVLILDRSSSMISNGGGADIDRQAPTIAAAQEFVRTMARPIKGQPSKHRIGVASFGSADSLAGEVAGQGGTIGNIAAGSYDYAEGIRADIGPVATQAQVDALNGVIAKLPAVGGTKYDQAMQYAIDLFNVDQSGQPRVVVFLSDGEPNSNEAGGLYDGIAQANTLKNNFKAEIYSIGVQMVEASDRHLKAVCTDDGAHYYPIRPAEDISNVFGVFEKIAEEITLAGYDAVVKDKINKEFFTFDTTRKMKVEQVVTKMDGNNLVVDAVKDVTTNYAGKYEVIGDAGEDQTVTWQVGNVKADRQILTIPVILNRGPGGVELTNGVYPTNLDVAAGRKGATINYTNFANLPCIQETQTPVLAKPHAAVTKVYFEVDNEGYPIDNGGVRLDDNDFLAYYSPVYTFGTEQYKKDDDVTVKVDDEVFIDANNNVFIFYPDVKNKAVTGVQTTKEHTFTINSDDEVHEIYFGFRKADTEKYKLRKEFEVDVKLKADFKVEVVGATISPVTANLGHNETMDLNLGETLIYKITETAVKGFKPVAPFFVQFTKAGGVAFVDEQGQAVAKPEAVSIDAANKTVKVNNAKDPAQIHDKDMTYTVKHYIEGNHQANDDITEKKSNVWINDTTMEVKAHTKTYPNYILENYEVDGKDVGTTLPATVKDKAVIEAHYGKGSVDPVDYKYKVEYYIDIGDGFYDLFKTLDKVQPTWPGYDKLTLTEAEIIKAAAIDMKDTNYVKTEPAVPTGGEIQVEKDGTIKVYVTGDIAKMVEKKFNVDYILDGKTPETKTITVDAWAQAKRVSVKANHIDIAQYAGYTLKSFVPSLGNDPKKPPIAIGVGETIKVNLQSNMQETKPVEYTIIYHKQEENSNDYTKELTETKSMNVWVGATEFKIPAIDKLKYNADGYEFEKTAPVGGDTGATLTKANPVLEVYYTKNTNATKSFAYQLSFYVDGKKDFTQPIKDNIWLGTTEYQVPEVDLANTIYKNRSLVIDSYEVAGVKSATPPILKVEAGKTDEVKVNLIKDPNATDLEIKVKYVFYENGTMLKGLNNTDISFEVTKSQHPSLGDKVKLETVESTPEGTAHLKDKLNGYKVLSYQPVIGTMLGNGSIARVNVVKDTTKTRPVTLTVVHKIGIEDYKEEEVIKNVWIGEDSLKVTQADVQVYITRMTASNGKGYGYSFQRADPGFGDIPIKADNTVTVTLEYVGNTSIKKTIRIPVEYHQWEVYPKPSPPSTAVPNVIDAYVQKEVPVFNPYVELKKEDLDMREDKFEGYKFKLFDGDQLDIPYGANGSKNGNEPIVIHYEESITASTPTMFPYKVKVVTKGGKITNGRFKFELNETTGGGSESVASYPGDNNNDKIGCTAQGNVVFKVYYRASDIGIKTYTIKQVNPPKGVTPDKRTFTVKVEVKRDSTGRIVGVPVYQSVASLTFENIG